jgi:1-acyl-sn-glycerol-3-phosphate acyltransferase
MRVPYDVAKRLLPVFLPFICRWDIKGGKSPLPEGPLVVAANHLSNFDIPLLGMSVSRRISFMGQEELFRFPLGPGFRLFDSFPIHRGRVDRQAFDKVNEVLSREGWALGMFPEGRKSPTAQLQPAHPGTALIALQSDAYILPVGISGTEKVKERIERPTSFFHRPLVTASIGKPFRLPQADGKMTRGHLKSCTDIIMAKLCELLPQAYHGVYAHGEQTSHAKSPVHATISQ